MRSALVTGGSSGIGLAIARMLREEGYELTLGHARARRSRPRAAELGAQAISADMSKEDGLRPRRRRAH